MARKPTPQEFKQTSIICGIGLFVLGFIGFVMLILMDSFIPWIIHDVFGHLIGGIEMTDAFIAFVRHEQELLLLRRSSSDPDSADLWDGVYGIGDTEEDVLNRVSECTGIPMEDLEYVRDGPALGIDIDGRLQDIAPCLVVSTSNEVTPAGRYTEAEWVDHGDIAWDNREKSEARACIFSNLEMEDR